MPTCTPTTHCAPCKPRVCCVPPPPPPESEGAYENLNFAREALARVYRPTGKRHSPGQTCRDIQAAHPEYKSGKT